MRPVVSGSGCGVVWQMSAAERPAVMIVARLHPFELDLANSHRSTLHRHAGASGGFTGCMQATGPSSMPRGHRVGESACLHDAGRRDPDTVLTRALCVAFRRSAAIGARRPGSGAYERSFACEARSRSSSSSMLSASDRPRAAEVVQRAPAQRSNEVDEQLEHRNGLVQLTKPSIDCAAATRSAPGRVGCRSRAIARSCSSSSAAR